MTPPTTHDRPTPAYQVRQMVTPRPTPNDSALAALRASAERLRELEGSWTEFGLRFRLPGDAEYLVAAIDAYEQHGQEVVLKSAARDTRVIRLFHRHRATAEDVERQRAADGADLTYDDVLGDGAAQIDRQHASVTWGPA